MSYEVLARRFRPLNFDDVAGQRHVTTTLANALESGKLPHALLFAGPRGVGKTSIARILARALNCDQGPTTKPCGECRSCVDIANSASLDVQEIDAASNTGVDSVREIRDSIRYTAAPGKYRIYIIDEVHMLSTQAFNALLKTLEEPPPNSLFIFATTDPQKIPATVLSRVQRFDLKRLSAADELDILRGICKSEKIEAPESVLRALVRESDGSARDALTLLDRLVAGIGSQITDEDAATVLDLVDRRVLWEILDPILSQDPALALTAARAGLDRGIEAQRLAADLLAELRHLLVARLVPEPAELIDLAPEEVAELAKRAADHSPETLQTLFRVLLQRVQDLAFAPRPSHALEMAVVRLATLPQAEALADVIARLDSMDGGGGGGASGGGAGGGGARKSGAAETARKPPTKRAARSEPKPPAEAAPAERPAEAAPRPRPKTSPQEQARLRKEAKTHPVVQSAMEILGAELRDIRTRDTP
jgi:DNA polymerase-3 subunit gamma/tau